jgi:membrane fusion protein (multidrug efflux system)
MHGKNETGETMSRSWSRTSAGFQLVASLVMCVAPSAVAQEKPRPAVLVAVAEEKALGRQTDFVGRVEAIEKVELRARVQGFLKERNFEAGANVEKGQKLFLVEPEPYEAELAQRKAQLASARATEQNASAQLARYRTLESKEVASTAQLDVRIADEARAKASVLEAEAAVTDAEIKLSYTTIVTPISGRIGRSSVDPGNLVGPDSGVLAVVVNTEKVYVLFPVTQAQLLAARRNTSAKDFTVRVRLADGSLLDTHGTIDFIDVVVDPRTDGQIVRAVIPNADGALSDGQTVRVLIEQINPEVAIAIPQAAVATDQAGQFVYVVNAASKVEQRRIKTGQSKDGLIAVTEGVAVGDRVIVQGLQKVRPGAEVTAQTADSTAKADGVAR